MKTEPGISREHFCLRGASGALLAAYLAFCVFCGAALAAEAPPRLKLRSPLGELRAAEKEFNQAGKEYTAAADTGSILSQSPATNNPPPPPIPKLNESRAEEKSATSAAKKPQAPREPVIANTRTAAEARDEALTGSPETGWAGTWTDPANGDIITSVIAPEAPKSQAQNYPIIIEPQVASGSWGVNSGDNWGTSWDNGWNTGPGQTGMWPGYPGNYGYPPPPPPPPNGSGGPTTWPGFNPGVLPGYNPSLNPGFNPGFPPPPNPGYRPLRPNLPPSMPGNNPSMLPPGLTPPASGWQNPGAAPFPNPGGSPPFGAAPTPPPLGNAPMPPPPPAGSPSFGGGAFNPPPAPGGFGGGARPGMGWR